MAFQALGELEIVEGGLRGLDGLRGQRRDAVPPSPPCGNLALPVLIDHGQRAAGEIAQAVGEIGIVAADERVVAEAAVLPEDHFAQQEVAQGVGAHHLLNRLGAHDVAARFAHLVVLEQQPAVGENALGQRQAGGHQEGRPVDRVEAHDLFADEVQVGRPEVLAIHRFAIDRAHVGGERVEPHVEHVRRFAVHRDAPFDVGARDGKIGEPGLHERDHFVAARLRLDEIRVAS
jgi:hypothetical protein